MLKFWCSHLQLLLLFVVASVVVGCAGKLDCSGPQKEII